MKKCIHRNKKIGIQKLVGKSVCAVYLSSDKRIIIFKLSQPYNTAENLLIFRADGEGCSSSWFEDIDTIEYLKGDEGETLPVLSVEQTEMTFNFPQPSSAMKAYSIIIKTIKGCCKIIFRNDAVHNGDYHGYLHQLSTDEAMCHVLEKGCYFNTISRGFLLKKINYEKMYTQE